MYHRKISRSVLASFLAASLACAPVASYAQSCDADTEARLDFLETRLDEGATAAKWWWGGWFGIFAIGVVYKSVQGGKTDDGSNQAADFMTAGKSLLGLADLTLRPHVARHGAAPMRVISKSTPEGCAERLRLAEKTMEQAAKEGNMRWDWKRHLSSLVLNLSVAAAIHAGYDDDGTAWRDFGVSEASAEAHIWSHPTRAVRDLDEYQQKFKGAPAAAIPTSFRLAATGRGIGMRWDF